MQPLPMENLPVSDEKTKSLKKSSAISSWKKSQQKKISIARDLLQTSSWLSKKAIAKHFGFARSTLYRPSKKSEKDKIYLDHILAIMREHPHYGKPRIALEMDRNIKLVRRIMLKYGLKSKKRPRRFKKPKDQGKPSSGIPNRIKHLCPIGNNIFWVGDFTELNFYDTRIFLATVIDQYTREVVGWNVGLHHTAEFVIEALHHAVNRRGLPYLFHSDQGSEYDSVACKAWLLAHRILPSHSKKATPGDNSHQESFYSRFKAEFGSPYRYQSLDELLEAIYRSIHYYNTKRMHRALKTTPIKKYEQAIKEESLRQINKRKIEENHQQQVSESVA